VPYPRRLLNPGEEIAFDLHPHWWYFAGVAAFGIIVLAAAAAAPQLFHGRARTLALWVVVVLIAVWLVWFATRLLTWRTTHFVLTTDRLIFRSGVLSRTGREIPLERVNDLSFHQGFFERIVGAGDLMIESAGEAGQDVFSRIPHPDRAQQDIYTQIENNRQKNSGGRVAESASIPEQIAELARLRDQGLVTDAEFQAKKAELLQRM
jgi:uncharacterized membrane protein YdbT with pleckstrin-like domain